MRTSVAACLTFFAFGLSATAANANLVNDNDGLFQPRIETAAEAQIRIPVRDLASTAGGSAYLALDAAKAKADEGHVFYAANEVATAQKSDAIETAAVAEFGAPAIDMNTRFYGSLLIFAAGCMMWLGLAVRRHP